MAAAVWVVASESNIRQIEPAVGVDQSDSIACGGERGGDAFADETFPAGVDAGYADQQSAIGRQIRSPADHF